MFRYYTDHQPMKCTDLRNSPPMIVFVNFTCEIEIESVNLLEYLYIFIYDNEYILIILH